MSSGNDRGTSQSRAVWSSPAADDRRVYFGSFDRHFYALDRDEPTLLDAYGADDPAEAGTAKTASFEDSGLKPDTTYYYYAAALSVSGVQGGLSLPAEVYFKGSEAAPAPAAAVPAVEAEPLSLEVHEGVAADGEGELPALVAPEALEGGHRQEAPLSGHGHLHERRGIQGHLDRARVDHREAGVTGLPHEQGEGQGLVRADGAGGLCERRPEPRGV